MAYDGTHKAINYLKLGFVGFFCVFSMSSCHLSLQNYIFKRYSAVMSLGSWPNLQSILLSAWLCCFEACHLGVVDLSVPKHRIYQQPASITWSAPGKGTFEPKRRKRKIAWWNSPQVLPMLILSGLSLLDCGNIRSIAAFFSIWTYVPWDSIHFEDGAFLGIELWTKKKLGKQNSPNFLPICCYPISLTGDVFQLHVLYICDLVLGWLFGGWLWRLPLDGALYHSQPQCGHLAVALFRAPGCDMLW